MTDITYTIVEHDGGWAYKVGDTFSETFPSHDAALAAAKTAAASAALRAAACVGKVSENTPSAL